MSGGYDSNAARTPVKTPSWFETVAPELLLNSNWQRHSLTATLRGSYTTYNDDHALDRPTFDGRLNGRVDVTSDTRLDLETRFLIATDNPGSPNVQAGVAKLPINTTLGGTFGFDQRFNRLDVALKGLVDRTVYRNRCSRTGPRRPTTTATSIATPQSCGSATSSRPPSSRSSNSASTPACTTSRSTATSSCAIPTGSSAAPAPPSNSRASSPATWRWAGSRAATRIPCCPISAALTLDGSLTWLASALTTVKFVAKTSAGESTLAGVAGVLTREGSVEIDHALRQWLIGTLRFTVDNDNYVGSARNDYRYAGSAAITYKLNRDMQLKGEYRREWLQSSIAGVDYLANVWLIGLRLQK